MFGLLRPHFDVFKTYAAYRVGSAGRLDLWSVPNPILLGLRLDRARSHGADRSHGDCGLYAFIDEKAGRNHARASKAATAVHENILSSPQPMP